MLTRQLLLGGDSKIGLLAWCENLAELGQQLAHRKMNLADSRAAPLTWSGSSRC